MRFVYISNPVGITQAVVFRPRLGIRILGVKLYLPAGSGTSFITFNSDSPTDTFDIFPNTPPFTVADSLALRSDEMYYVCVELHAGAPVHMTIPGNGNIQFLYELL